MKIFTKDFEKNQKKIAGDKYAQMQAKYTKACILHASGKT